MDNNNVIIYLIQAGEYLVTDIEQNFEILSRGAVLKVMQDINALLGDSKLDFALDSELVTINEEGSVATIESENTWLLIEIAVNEYRIFKNPAGRTETIHKTHKGSLVGLINILYSKITSLT